MNQKDSKYYYELVKDTIILASMEYFFTSKREYGVISGTTAAIVWGFSNVWPEKINLTFPKSRISMDARSEEFSCKQLIESKYNIGIVELRWNSSLIRIYNPERTIIDIIKEESDFFDDITVSTLKKFFREFDYDQKKLYEYARIFNISTELRIIENLLTSN